MSGQFFSMILVDRLPVLESDEVKAALQAFSRTDAGTVLGSIDSVDASRGNVPGEALVFQTTAGLVTAMFVSSPVPPGTLDNAIQRNAVWPEAGEVLRNHKGHVIIASLGGGEGLEGALKSARLVSLATVAVMDLLPVLGVYWAPGDVVSPTKQFATSAGNAATNLPLDVWLQMAFYQQENAAGEAPSVGLMTTGLVPFVGREIDFQPGTLPPAAVAQRVIGTAAYLLQTGTVFSDGDTLGLSQTEKIEVRLVEDEVPLIKLVYRKEGN